MKQLEKTVYQHFSLYGPSITAVKKGVGGILFGLVFNFDGVCSQAALLMASNWLIVKRTC